MNKDALIIIPIFILFSLSMFSMLGLNEGELASGYIVPETEYPYYYDYTGRPLIYIENMTDVNEAGTTSRYWVFNESWTPENGFPTSYVIWDNETWNPFNPTYYLYYTPTDGINDIEPVTWDDYSDRRVGVASQGILSITGDWTTSLGLIALVVSLCIVVAIIGIKIVDSGESETAQKVIIVSSGLIALWSVFSVLSLNLLALIPYGFGAVLYFGLTLSYVMGIIMRYT